MTRSTARSVLSVLIRTIVLALSPTRVGAQVVITPASGIQFAPSADHNAQVGGTNVVAGYRATVLTSPAGTSVGAAIDLGKPTPVGGQITVKPFSGFATLAPGSYTVSLVAVGPGGTSSAMLSDPFAVQVAKPGAPGKPVAVP